MRIGISLIELNRLQRGFQPLLQIGYRILRPAIGNDTCGYPREPYVRLRKLGIELASLTKQLASFKMIFARHR